MSVIRWNIKAWEHNLLNLKSFKPCDKSQIAQSKIGKTNLKLNKHKNETTEEQHNSS